MFASIRAPLTFYREPPRPSVPNVPGDISLPAEPRPPTGARFPCATISERGEPLNFAAERVELVVWTDPSTRVLWRPVVLLQRGPEYLDVVPLPPDGFTEVDADLCSAGAYAAYYQDLERLDAGLREAILVGLRDTYYLTELAEEQEKWPGFASSIGRGTIREQRDWYRATYGRRTESKPPRAWVVYDDDPDVGEEMIGGEGRLLRFPRSAYASQIRVLDEVFLSRPTGEERYLGGTIPFGWVEDLSDGVSAKQAKRLPGARPNVITDTFGRDLLRSNLIAPVFEGPRSSIAAELAEWVRDCGRPIRLNLQLHKLLWGDVPGR